MEILATQRLIDGTARLDAPDRALLNIWANQGLEDERIARLTGIDSERVAWRRERLVGRLADELGDPPREVRAALEQIAATTREAKARSDGELAILGPAAGSSAGHRADRPGQPSVATEQSAPARRGGRQRGVMAALAALVLAAVVIEIFAMSPGGTEHRLVSDRMAAVATRSNTALAVSASPDPPAGTTTPPTQARAAGLPRVRSIKRLAPLPGIHTSLNGWVGLTGAGSNIKLKLRLTVPSSRGRGRYEIWLYNSILDARALGVLRTGTYTARYALPTDASRYRWIDISLQPGNSIVDSGESQLRAANPAYARPAH